MVVRRDFEDLYRRETDPWRIGSADAERYGAYRDAIRREAPPQGFRAALDLGCGKGAFTSHLREVARSVTGVELSEIAVAKARAEHPGIRFVRGDARDLGRLGFPPGSFDLIVCSDLISYFTVPEVSRLFAEIGRLLAPEGRFFLAAWAPGGRYYTPEWIERFTAARFAILAGRTLPSQHALLVARRRWRDVVLTLDYETWQPVPPGRRIDWEETVLRPAERWMLLAERYRVPLTFFVEMGEVLFLRRNAPHVAARLEAQIRDAVRRGHDIQLHLHPEWLPEARPAVDLARGEGVWDETRNRIHTLGIPPVEVLRRTKDALEEIVRGADPGYRVRVFRAGKYRIQPGAEILAALAACGIEADSSVWRGGYSFEDRFDFRTAWSGLAPYSPSPGDINLPAPPSEEGVLEFPIRSRAGARFGFDGAVEEALRDAIDSAAREDRLAAFRLRHPTAWRRIAKRLRRLPPLRRHPRFDHDPAPETCRNGDDTFVAIGHTKGGWNRAAIEGFLREFSGREEFRFRRFAEVVEDRLAERRARRVSATEIRAAQVERETGAVLGEERNERQSARLQRLIPPDRKRVLDLGCGAGYWTRRLDDRFGFCIGVDAGEAFLRKARRTHRAEVARCDFHQLPFPGGCFDTVYADNVLEHSPDPAALLGEIRRVLARRGLLVAAIPPDARNPRFPVSDHLWKTDRADVERRLRAAGFTRLRVREVDTVRAFGMAPYPASGNTMLYLTAWSGEGEYTDAERAADLMEFVYRSLDPSRSQENLDPEAILRGGFAWCLGYCAVLGDLARREGIPARWVTLEAHDHPRGRGERGVDTHELVELRIGGKWIAFDPMANRVLGGSVEELLADPSRADRAASTRLPDERFRSRGYHLYCSSFFYERVVRYCRRGSLEGGEPWRWIPVTRSPRTAQGIGPTRRLHLADGSPEPESGDSGTGETRIWTRDDFASRRIRSALAALRAMPEDSFEILTEDLAWQERVIRLHLLGALAPAGRKLLRDRKGRVEPLGWGPLLFRQIPSFAAGVVAAGAAVPRLRAVLTALSALPRREPDLPAARRPSEILYVRSDLWRGLRAGGSVGHIAGMARAFARAGRPVVFLCADPPAGIDRDRMAVHEVPPPRRIRVSRSAARFEHSFRLARAGRDLFGRNPPGLLYHRFDEGSIAGVLLSRALRIPLVLEYNGSGIWIADNWDRPLPYRGTFRAIEAANLRHAHLVVTVSRVLAEELEAKGVDRRRILVRPNGVDPEIFHPGRDGAEIRRRLGLEGRTVIGFLGTFGPWHGAPVLARAVRSVLRRRPEAAFLFVGEGPEREAARRIVREEGVEEACRFPGLVPQDRAPEYLAACDLYASPHVPNPDGTRFFGSPTKLFEYLAMGKPVVASRLEQIGEILEDGVDGLLVPPGDPEALAEALARLAGEPDLRERIGRAGRARVIGRHTWDAIAAAVLDLVQFL